MKMIFAVTTCLLAGCAHTGSPKTAVTPPGARYVAMGSSYAAGAGIGPLVVGTPKRCGRTANNYAHLVAAELRLDLTDVSCGGATTANILTHWAELPAQVDALTPDTKLVTITIGGNDLNYVRNMMIAAACNPGGAATSTDTRCPAVSWPSEADYGALERRLHEISQVVRQRSPQARLIFIDYVRVLPDTGRCAATPLGEAQMSAARSTFRRLAKITETIARAEGATLLPVSRLSKGHDGCSADPWGAGHPGHPSDWHPTAAGHGAIAKALVALFRRG